MPVFAPASPFRLLAWPAVVLFLSLWAAAAVCSSEVDAAAGGAGPAGGTPGERVELVRVFDGDTLLVRRRGEEERVRLVGIDAPEAGRGGRSEAGAAAATSRARAWLEGRTIALVFDPAHEETGHRDRYGRLLAYVVDGTGEDLGRLLLAEGHARLFRKFDFERRTEYVEAQAAARRARRGMWAGGAAAELAALAEEEGAAIALYATGGDLWAICMAGRVRLEVLPEELPVLLRRLRELQLAHLGAALGRALEDEGFQPAGARCPAP